MARGLGCAAINEENVEQAVLIKIEKCGSGPHCLHQVLLRRSPVVVMEQNTILLSHVHKRNRHKTEEGLDRMAIRH